MPATTHTGNAVLNLLLRGIPYAQPDKIYVALHTGDPGVGGANNQVTTAKWPQYKRLHMSAGAGIADGFIEPAAKKTENTKQILFPSMDGAASITISHWSFWTQETGGNCLWYGELEYVKTLNPTDEIVIHPNELKLSID